MRTPLEIGTDPIRTGGIVSQQKVFPFRATLERTVPEGARSQRSGWLTPYEVETLYTDALWAGRGARLEVSVPARTSEEGLGWIRDRFDRLSKRGVGVRVRRDESWEFRDLLGATAH